MELFGVNTKLSKIAFEMTRKEGQALHEWVSAAKDWYKDNNGYVWDFPLNNDDIAQLKFMNKMEVSEREHDLLFIHDRLRSARELLHFTIMMNNGEMSEIDWEELGEVYKRLKKYGLEECLLDHVDEKVLLEVIR